MVMFQFRQPDEVPSMDSVRRRFGLGELEMDAEFGVIATDPAESLYCVLLTAEAAGRATARLGKASGDPAQGGFSNPQVEPFGPPSAFVPPSD